MTRKKFVKMLMGRGLSRNKANAYAVKVRAENGTYEKRYKDLGTATNLAKAMKITADNFIVLGKAIGEMVTMLKQLSNEIRSAEKRVVTINEACDTCLRWPECNGVDANSCPIVQAQTKTLERA